MVQLKKSESYCRGESEPHDALEVRSFLGLANYNARCISDFATIAEPLRRSTTKGVCFKFGHEQRKVFNELKSRLASADTLGYFEKCQDTNYSRCKPSWSRRSNCSRTTKKKESSQLVSKSLSEEEKRHSQTEKEVLAVVWVCERFHAYLCGIEFHRLQAVGDIIFKQTKSVREN